MEKLRVLLEEMSAPDNEVDVIRHVVRPTIIRGALNDMGFEDTAINIINNLIKHNQELLEQVMHERVSSKILKTEVERINGILEQRMTETALKNIDSIISSPPSSLTEARLNHEITSKVLRREEEKHYRAGEGKVYTHSESSDRKA